MDLEYDSHNNTMTIVYNSNDNRSHDNNHITSNNSIAAVITCYELLIAFCMFRV